MTKKLDFNFDEFEINILNKSKTLGTLETLECNVIKFKKSLKKPTTKNINYRYQNNIINFKRKEHKNDK